MLSAFWLIGWPALVIADRAMAVNFFPSGLRLDDDGFLISYIATFIFFVYVDWAMRRPRHSRSEAILSEEDRLRLRNITAAYNDVAAHINEQNQRINAQTGAVNRQHRIDGEFRQAAANAIAAFDAWTSHVPELPSTRHAFERAILRLRQEVNRRSS